MYNKSWLENLAPSKNLYYTVICGKISIIYLTDNEADRYRNKYGSLHEKRSMAEREVAACV